MNTNRILFSILLTMTGVLLGIKAVYGGVRLDWAETALVAGAVLVTVGVAEMANHINHMKGGNETDGKDFD